MDCKKGKPSARNGLWHCIFWKLESLERNVLRSFQIGPLEAWENVIQRGTTCLWEHLKYGVWILSYNIFHHNCFLISQIGKPLYIIYLPLPSSDWNDQGELFSTNIFSEKFSYGKVNEKWKFGELFFDQHFFSKHFPMEKSMKNENLGNVFSTNIFFEKFSYGKVNENENFGNFFFDQHFFRKFFLWKSQWKMKILIFRKNRIPGEDLQ